MSVTRASLSSEIWKRADLTDDHREQMFALMERHYDEVNRSQFFDDLAGKDEVILLIDNDRRVCGFSTLAWNPGGWSGAEDIIFSGDTVIAREAWGSQELVKAFCRRAGEWQAERGRRLFWLLISKGHRTYLYLPLFMRRFFPSPDGDDEELAPLANEVAKKLFEDYLHEDCVLRFPKSRGQLKPDLAEDARAREGSRFVRYFLERNPGYRSGDELICFTEFAEENLKRLARTAFLEGRER